jgi:homoserine dehydrogenase
VLVGFGNVGRRFVHLAAGRGERLRDDGDVTLRITGIATRSHGAVYDAAGLDAIALARQVEGGGSLGGPDGARIGSLDAIERLSRSDAPLRIMIETTTLDIAAGEPAIGHVRHALECGCHVVTANKGPAAFAYHALSSLAVSKGVRFLFEGAVMDGIPIFNLVRDTLPTVRIEGFRGVVNSTTNHILTALEDGQAFAPALAHMQAEGIAEADPSLDVDGWDAAAKTAILANVFLDARVTPHHVDRTGIGPDTAARARAAVANGYRLRLVASASRTERPSVRLIELAPDDLLAGLRGTANALILDTDTLGRLAISQLDGGLTQTAYALLTDVITIARRAC